MSLQKRSSAPITSVVDSNFFVTTSDLIRLNMMLGHSKYQSHGRRVPSPFHAQWAVAAMEHAPSHVKHVIKKISSHYSLLSSSRASEPIAIGIWHFRSSDRLLRDKFADGLDNDATDSLKQPVGSKISFPTIRILEVYFKKTIIHSDEREGSR